MWFAIAVERVRLLVLRLRARVAAGRLGVFGDQLVRDERRAEAEHLLARRRAHVERRNDAAESPAGGDRLESGDARADDEDLGRRDVAGGGREHRQELSERRRADQHALVTGDRALRRQHVHRLRARDARDELEREGGDPPGGERLNDLGALPGSQQRDERRALGHAGAISWASGGWTLAIIGAAAKAAAASGTIVAPTAS